MLKKAQSAIESRIRAAYDWLDDGLALRGGVGEKSLRQIIEQASRLAERYLPPSQAEPMSKLASQIVTMTDALCELRQNEKGYYKFYKIYYVTELSCKMNTTFVWNCNHLYNGRIFLNQLHFYYRKYFVLFKSQLFNYVRRM